MPRDPNSGIYSIPANSAAIPGQPISSSSWNNLVADIGNEITYTIDPRGETPMTANLNMGGQKITNVANGSASSDLANISQLPAAPTGLIVWFPNTKIQSGYLSVNGADTYSRTTYANLFALLGTNYGSGDGSTTFGTPAASNDDKNQTDVTIAIKT